MKASNARKQLNIRSDTAYARAHRLARARSMSVTAVIEQALAKLEDDDGPTGDGLTQEQIARSKRKLDAARRAMWGPEGPPKGLTSDHSWLYDEHGLPK